MDTELKAGLACEPGLNPTGGPLATSSLSAISRIPYEDFARQKRANEYGPGSPFSPPAGALEACQ